MGGQGLALGADVSYWTHVLPFVVLMAFGMGLNFVPLTLVAVHRLRREDTGIGSGVLNTMQQVGGALGLATLSTVALHFSQARADELAPEVAQAAQAAGIDQAVSPASSSSSSASSPGSGPSPRAPRWRSSWGA